MGRLALCRHVSSLARHFSLDGVAWPMVFSQAQLSRRVVQNAQLDSSAGTGWRVTFGSVSRHPQATSHDVKISTHRTQCEGHQSSFGNVGKWKRNVEATGVVCDQGHTCLFLFCVSGTLSGVVRRGHMINFCVWCTTRWSLLGPQKSQTKKQISGTQTMMTMN